MAPPNTDINFPETRMTGQAPNQQWQWKFGDDTKWRDMMQSITMDMQKEQVTKLPDWLLGGAVLKKGSVSWVAWTDVRKWAGLGEDYPKVVADFDVLVKHTDLLPDDFEQTSSKEYMLALAELWREVTGYVPTKENKPARYDSNQTYKQNIIAEDELFDIAVDLADDLEWEKTSTARGYDVDWSDPNAIAHFMNMSHDDHIRGKTYDDDASLESGTNAVFSMDDIKTADKEADSIGWTTSDRDSRPSGLKRKVVGEFGEGAGNRNIANATAAKIPNSKVEEIDGQWVITVPPGQGGFEGIDAGNTFIRDSGLDATKWEMASSAEGEFVIREKKPEGTQGHDTVEAARKALEKTGADSSQYEFRANTDGKIYPVYTGTPEAYSTPTTTDTKGNTIPGTPGDMFEPTITEDPTGRKIGLDASGQFQDFGYGMAGDITQENLAGYQVPHRSLPMIVAKAIEQGNWELARGVQAVIDQPTNMELLEHAARYAEAPADLAVLSAIARGEQMVQPAVPLPEGMGTGMGQATRIGAPGEVYTAAYKRVLDSLEGGYVPNEDELRELFDPKNDPAYIATKELSDKYETEIGNLRNQIAEANKTASERIESTQTNTMNMMTGMFENTIKSFKDLMKSSTSMQDTEIDRLLEENNTLRMGGNGDVYKRQTERGAQPDHAKRIAEWKAHNVQKFDVNPDVGLLEGMTPTQIITWLDDPSNWNQGTPEDIPTDTGKVIPEVIPEGTGEVISEGTGGSTGFTLPTSEDVTQYDKGFAGTVDPGIFKNLRQGTTGGPGTGALSGAGMGSMGTSSMTGGEGPGVYEYSAPEMAQREKFATSFGMKPTELDPTIGMRYDYDPDMMAEGGVVQGPTMALLGEKEPEFIVPFSKVDEFKRGQLPLGKPRKSQMGGTVAKFEDSIPRFANGGMVTGPERNYRFGGVTGGALKPYGDSGAYVTPETRTELELGAKGIYGADGIGRAPRIAPTDFQSLMERYPDNPVDAGLYESGQAGRGSNIPEYELRQRLGASEFAGTDPAEHPIGIQQLMAGRPMGRPRSLMTAANMPKPSGQALRNMLPSEKAYYQKMGRMAGIPQAELEQEMRSVMPGGTRRTPLRMGARRVRQA